MSKGKKKPSKPLIGRLGPLETMGRKAGPHQDKRRKPRSQEKEETRGINLDTNSFYGPHE